MPRWFFWTLLTLISWGIWGVLYRLLVGQISEIHSQAVSTLGVVPIMAALASMKYGPAGGSLRLGRLLAFSSGIFSCLGNIACYAAISDAKAATVVPLTALYPVVTILLALPLLGERLNRFQWTGVAVSLVALLLFNVQSDMNVGRTIDSPWILLALAAVALWGITGLMQKMSTNHISAQSSAFWFLAAFIPVAAGIWLYSLMFDAPLPTSISPRIWGIAIALGFTLALGNLTVLLAYASGGKASIITPLAGLYPVVSLPIAILALDEKITIRESAAIALALVAVVMLSYQSQADESCANR